MIYLFNKSYSSYNKLPKYLIYILKKKKIFFESINVQKDDEISQTGQLLKIWPKDFVVFIFFFLAKTKAVG